MCVLKKQSFALLAHADSMFLFVSLLIPNIPMNAKRERVKNRECE